MMSRHHGTFKKLNIPGPAPWPIIGSLIEINTGGFQKFQMDCMRKYGKVYGFYGGLSPMTIEIGDKEMLRIILVKEFANFTDRIVFKGFNGDVDTGINNLSGDHWRHVRSKITPAFSTGKLRKMAPLIDHASDTLVESLMRNVKGGNDVIEMMEVYGGYTMDVICSTAFGIQIDSQNNPNDEFVTNARKFLNLKLASPLILVLIFLPKLHFLMPLMGWSFLDKDIQAFFRRVTTTLLAARIAGDKSRVDFLQLMKNAQYEKEDSDEEDDNEYISVKKPSTSWSRKGITFDEILGNAETFFFAGYETTTITLSMASYYLAMYPEYQDKLRQELLDKIGSKTMTYDNIRDVEYLEMVINETLRISPPATRTDRVCLKDTEVNGIKIPAGMNISVPIYGIHHDPDNWRDPEKFIPERFAEKDSYDPMTFLPFGYGPRICIGMRLVQMELKLSLAKVIRNFRISISSETQIPPEMMKLGLLKPKTVKLKLEEIK
ncbi:cytochrome P450 3A8-like [Mizuhopecten yessoensis]|uniref:Cytochrome P450 3A4 n=1 Tax=Mizuhopecten yessoensis TaxID=6573 RepID=A0A210R170_MIZYE|nr:cytochrome P450 3A8-like [Mizuhopecten yessoensis]OWF54739.1 Cytochrome P450 3A4 [Mizuhopecten yessoensis]